MSDDELKFATEFIGLMSALIALIVIIAKFGLPRLSSTVIRCEGRADQIRMSDKHSYFCDRIALDWVISIATIKISPFKSSIRANIVGTDVVTGALKNGRMEGKGVHCNGVICIIYRAYLPSTGERWNGVMCLMCPAVGPLYGFWLAPHAEVSGSFAQGLVDLERK